MNLKGKTIVLGITGGIAAYKMPNVAHALAKAVGYLATTAGKLVELAEQTDRIPRIGTSWSLGAWLNRQKFHYKISSHYHKQPYYAMWLVNEYKNKMLKRS